MTKREKVLAAVVGGTLAVLLNFFLISFFFKNHAALMRDSARKTSQLQSLKNLIADKDAWESKGTWLAANQPKLDDPLTAASNLMNEVLEVAQRNQVYIAPETRGYGSSARREHYTTVPITVATKSKWPDLIKFLAELQAPEKFIVVERSHLQVDSSDKTQMKGELTIAKWYVPK